MGRKVIHAEGLGKRYSLGTSSGLDLRRGILSNLRGVMGRGKADFWALRNVGFDLQEGQAMGIIGRNGAGKSTLLKLLSRITVPTEGRFWIDGRVSSLLEVGTGFHLDLTGRENIYLNGTILGMRRSEVKAKFEEIVDFSGVEQFLDTPVKFYSNGQRVRLAFAVAAHLEPEVLIIDEVLAVGDVEFQRKCLGKMKDVTGNGRTVLFVSHNMSAIRNLCSSCLLLDHGAVEDVGDTERIITRYFDKNNAGVIGSQDLRGRPIGDGTAARLLQARWTDTAGRAIDHIAVNRPFHLEVEFEVLRPGFNPQPLLLLHGAGGDLVFSSFPTHRQGTLLSPGRYRTRCHFPPDLFNEGIYYAGVHLNTWVPFKNHQTEDNLLSIQVIEDLDSSTRAPSYVSIQGLLRPRLQWDEHPLKD